MKLEDQVTSLELSKMLKKLGVRQDSLFYWVISLTTDYHLSYTEGDKFLLPKDRNDFYAAYTVAELGELLPENYYTAKSDNQWFCYKEQERDGRAIMFYIGITADTEVEARGQLLLYLLEETDEVCFCHCHVSTEKPCNDKHNCKHCTRDSGMEVSEV